MTTARSFTPEPFAAVRTTPIHPPPLHIVTDDEAEAAPITQRAPTIASTLSRIDMIAIGAHSVDLSTPEGVDVIDLLAAQLEDVAVHELPPFFFG